MRSSRFGAGIAILVAAAMVLSMVMAAPAVAKPKKIGFGSTTYSVNEGDGSAQITITRTAARGTASVTFYTGPSTSATPNNDFTPVTATTVSFAVGETSATVQVPVLVSGVSGESDETVPLVLTGPSKGYKLGVASATLTIVELPAPPAPNINYLNPYNQAGLAWTMPAWWTYPTTYSVFRSTTGASGTWGIPIASNLSVKAYQDLDVVVGETYWYIVAAANQEGRSTNSNIVSITVQAS
jgi:hypothetical protein